MAHLICFSVNQRKRDRTRLSYDQACLILRRLWEKCICKRQAWSEIYVWDSSGSSEKSEDIEKPKLHFHTGTTYKGQGLRASQGQNDHLIPWKFRFSPWFSINSTFHCPLIFFAMFPLMASLVPSEIPLEINDYVPLFPKTSGRLSGFVPQQLRLGLYFQNLKVIFHYLGSVLMTIDTWNKSWKF